MIAKRNLKSQLEELMRCLRRTGLHRGREPLDILEEHARKGQSVRDNLIFLVSDFCPAAADSATDNTAEWHDVLRALSCDVCPVVISFALDERQRGSIRLWDAERRRHRLTLLSPARIAAINAEERQRVARLERLFRSLRLDFIVLNRERDVYPELARLARWRRKRRH